MNPIVVYLCLIIFGNTFSIGAFPVLLPEIGRGLGIDDFALGAVAGAFGLARVLADIPGGLFITHYLKRGLALGAIAVSAGVLCMSAGGPYWLLVAGRGLCGVGHALTMLAGLTIIVRHAPLRNLSLNAYEMSAMLGVLGGMLAAGFLPSKWPWNVTLVVASAPQFFGLLLLPSVLRAVPSEDNAETRRGLPSLSYFGRKPADARTRVSRTTILAFAAGCAIALAWSSVGQFILPLRASREFGLSRDGVALLLSLPQVVDVLFLLPLGRLADRTGHRRLLGVVLVVLAAGLLAVVYGSLYVAVVGCLLFGIGLAAWMLPVSLLNEDAPGHTIAWRTALYRVGVDAGVFVGPVLSGLLAQHGALWALTAGTAAALVGLSVAVLRTSNAKKVSSPQRA